MEDQNRPSICWSPTSLSTNGGLRQSHTGMRLQFRLWPHALLLGLLAWCLEPECVHGADGAGTTFFGDAEPLVIRLTVETNDLASRPREYTHGTAQIGSYPAVPVQVRLRGVSSFQPIHRKPSLALKFDSEPARRRFDGLHKLLLNNCVGDRSCMREHLANWIYSRGAVPAAHTRPARVYINGRDAGIYTALEAMNKQFLQREFANASGNLYEGTIQDVNGRLEQDNGNDQSREDVKALLSACTEPDLEKRWERLNDVLDVEQFLRFAAIQMQLGDTDGYLRNRNNYRFYRDPASRKFKFIPHGLDSTFIRGVGMFPPATNGLVMSSLWSIPRAQMRYAAISRSFMTNMWGSQALTNEFWHYAERLLRVAQNTNETQFLERCAQSLFEQIRARGDEVKTALESPEPVLVDISKAGESMVLSNWSGFVHLGNPALSHVTNSEGAFLFIGAASPASAGWRCRTLIPRGDYFFSCKARSTSTAVVLTHIDGDLGGATLKGSGEWEDIRYRFRSIENRRAADFLIELQAGRGNIFIDLGSMKITRDEQLPPSRH